MRNNDTAKLLRSVLGSLNAIFAGLDDGRVALRAGRNTGFVRMFANILRAAANESETGCPEAPRLSRVVDDGFDSIDMLNALIRGMRERSFSTALESCVLDAAAADNLMARIDDNGVLTDDGCAFWLDHARRLCESGPRALARYLNGLGSPRLTRLDPRIPLTLNPGGEIFKRRGHRLSKKVLTELRARITAADSFEGSRAFRYFDGDFHPAVLSSIRTVDKFFGYPSARENFHRHFRDFAAGESNFPLFITSLPGLGKTHFTISYALSFPDLTLILPEPKDLGAGLERLLRALSRRRNRRFVLFFDDVNINEIDWYYFRTHVGGSFMPPENTAIVIASNQEFPANILSRGRGFTFPIFDEVNCQEMIYDYLVNSRMRHPNRELVSVIAADYVEEYGQKRFEELSPRTLVRYLDRYDRDITKRKRMLEMSREDVIAKPDPQCFYELNVKLMSALYGEDAIARMRDQQLTVN